MVKYILYLHLPPLNPGLLESVPCLGVGVTLASNMTTGEDSVTPLLTRPNLCGIAQMTTTVKTNAWQHIVLSLARCSLVLCKCLLQWTQGEGEGEHG